MCSTDPMKKKSTYEIEREISERKEKGLPTGRLEAELRDREERSENAWAGALTDDYDDDDDDDDDDD